MSDNALRTQELLAQEGLESIGQKLFNTINIELSGNPRSARRWVWELLQNAKDVIVKNGKIEINLTENSVEFSHNGSPFSHNQLLAILSQRSTKSPSYTDDEKQGFFEKLFGEQGVDETEARTFLNTSGRFGTGFMTTYLLSKKVSLGGIYSTNGLVRSFKISLDRDAATDVIMKEKVKESFSSFTELEHQTSVENAIKNYQEGSNCDTKFIYRFDKEGKAVAELGIADLHNAIPFVLAFVGKINSVTINESGKRTVYSRKEEKQIGQITIEKIEKVSASKIETIELAKLSEKHEALTIAVQVKNVAGNKYELIPLSENTPRQFISFPLVGSETFPFPVIINSPLFNPDDSRSHVYLNITKSQNFDKKVNLNRRLFEKAVMLYSSLLTFGSTEKWLNLHFLAKSDLPRDVDESWYKEKIQKQIRTSVLDAEIVINERGDRVKPRNAKFPIYGKSKLDEFWELCKFVCADQIPRKNDAEVWKGIIEANTSDWLGADFDLTLEKLLQLIQNTSSFKVFNETYFQNETYAFSALNKIIQFTENEDKELLNRKENPLRVFPSQATDSPFTEKQKLSRDMKVPRQLKDVLKATGDDWYDKLVRDEITVFERDNKLTVKILSDKIRDKIDYYFQNKLSIAEKAALDLGLFELANLSTIATKSEIEALNKFLRQFFDSPNQLIQVISDAEDFDWKPFKSWAVRTILKKISTFETLDNLSLHLLNQKYPEIKESYSEAEDDLMFKVDSSLNEVIQYTISYDKNLLSEYSVIPNQLNAFRKFNTEIFNDENIPSDLKKIMTDFGKDCRGSLLHKGISINLPGEPRTLKWICDELDDLAIKEQENPELKQPIRQLDKWISKNKGTIKGMDELFKSFYRKRSGIVLNTYGLEERDQFDEILKSGMSADFAQIVKSGTTSETIRQVADLLMTNPDLSSEKVKEIAELLKEHPDLTSEKIEQLIELSKGWNPELTYSPDEEKKRRNFENGWKGEAFVYKQLLQKNFKVEWRNKSETDTGNFIVDFEGEKHFITERFDKYDLLAENGERKFYIQVKSTTTGISDADQIAMPISIREWNFVFETKENEGYYLARVFSVNSKPNVYFMKLERPQEL